MRDHLGSCTCYSFLKLVYMKCLLANSIITYYMCIELKSSSLYIPPSCTWGKQCLPPQYHPVALHIPDRCSR